MDVPDSTDVTDMEEKAQIKADHQPHSQGEVCPHVWVLAFFSVFPDSQGCNVTRKAVS